MLLARCPHCRSVDFRGVGDRNSLETTLRRLFVPFRCMLCGRHFFILRWLAPTEETT